MYQAVLFDLDGTLLDTLEDLAAAANHALHTFGYPTHETARYRYFVGNGMAKLIQRIVPPDCSEARQAAVYERFTAYYAGHYLDRTRPYPGLVPLLQTLHAAGVKTGVVTNKNHAFAVPLIRRWYGETIDAVRGVEPGAAKKPDPSPVFAVLAQLGAERAQTLYVGDSDVDMQTAKNAGLDSCGVLWGFRGAQELLQSGARFLAADAGALRDLIL